MDMRAYTQAFVDDARDSMAKAHAALQILRKLPRDEKQLYEVMRLFHSIKSTAVMMGLQEISDLCGSIELLYKGILEKGGSVSSDALETAEKATKQVEEAVAAFAKRKAS